MPQQWKYATTNVLQKKKNRTSCNNYRGTFLVAHAGEVLLKVIAGRQSEYYYERGNILPEKQCGVRPQHSTVDMMFVVRRLQELAQNKDTLMYFCFIDLTKAYDSVDRTILWDFLLVLVCHRECSSLSANSTTACKHSYGWMMEKAQIRLTWDKVSGNEACSRHC